MDKATIAKLSKTDEDPGMISLLNTTKALVNQSRCAMARFYDQWDENLNVFKAKRAFTKQDDKASSKDQPVQMIIPLTYSQIMTFVAFGFVLLLQNKHFYEFEPSGSEDYSVEDDLVSLLDRDVKKNSWQVKLFLFLLDVARLNLGVYEAYWCKETLDVSVPVEFQPTDPATGQPVGEPYTEYQTRPVLKYEGNRICNVSPYKFFPDMRLPLVRYQEGEFCASEEEFTYVHLKDLERKGEVAGIDEVPQMSDAQWKARGCETRRSHYSTPVDVPAPRGIGASQSFPGTDDSAAQSKGMYHVTKVQRRLIPAKFEIDGKPIGKEEYPIMYVIWYANDQRIIKYERSTNLHNHFTYYVASYTPDHLEQLSIGLADLIDKLQSTATWLINSRITNVRRAVNNKFVIQPELLDQRSLNADSPYILLKKGTGAGGIDRAIKQLNVADTTAGHFNDANSILSLIQLSSGISENSLGQYTSGRRSARQTAAVQAGESSRLIMHFTLMWEQCFGPLGQDMLTQLRQGVSPETVTRVLGKATLTDPLIPFQQRFDAIRGTVEELVGTEDYFIMPGTTPSEKGALAATLTELFTAIISNPQTMVAMGLDPTKILLEIFRLRGLKHIDRFVQAAPPQQAQMLAATGTVPPPQQPAAPPTVLPAPSTPPSAAA